MDSANEKSTRVNNSNELITGFNGLPLIPINVDDMHSIGYSPEKTNEEDNGKSTGIDDCDKTRTD